MKAALLATSTVIYALQELAGKIDIWAVLDKYGFPTAMLAVSIVFIWNRQKKADTERNELIAANNVLLQELITTTKIQNACKFIGK